MRQCRYTFPTTLVLFAALVSSMLLCLTSCSYILDDLDSDTTEVFFEPDPGPYFDKHAFVNNGGRYYYDDGEKVTDLTGVDISDHQEYIDWHAVAADGIGFAFLRIGFRGSTEGGLYPDERFEENLAQAHEAGLACGAYFYSQATSVQEAEEEAAFVLGLLDGRPLEYPVAFDYEVVPSTRIAGISTEEASAIATAFCAAIRAGGYEPMVYGNTFDLARFDAQTLEGIDIWCAEYDDGPSYERKPDIWQYTNQGYVEGIDGLADLNLDLRSVE